MAGLGVAGYGPLRRGRAWSGRASRGRVWQDWARSGRARSGEAWQGSVGPARTRNGVVRLGVARSGLVRRDVVRRALLRRGSARHGSAWCGQVGCGWVRCGAAEVRPGRAGCGSVELGAVGQAAVRPGAAGLAVVWLARQEAAWSGEVRYARARLALAGRGVARRGLAWDGSAWWYMGPGPPGVGGDGQPGPAVPERCHFPGSAPAPFSVIGVDRRAGIPHTVTTEYEREGAMSVDAQITLPGFVSIRNVADAIGILAGNERHIQTLHGSAGDFQVVRVDGVETKGSSVGPECADIAIRRGNETLLYVLYHFEWKYTGERGLMPPARPEWLAIGKGLVDLFGGRLDYSDWDDVVD